MVTVGCEDLHEIVDPESCRLAAFSGRTLAIDAAFWFQRYYFARTVTELSPEARVVGSSDISQSLSLLLSLPDLFRHDIVPIFVFDPMQRSRPSKSNPTSEHLEHAPDPSEPEKHLPFLQQPTKTVLETLDIPYCEAPLYAEADASVFAQNGRADAVVSNDYDTLLYGSPITMRKRPNESMWQKVELETVLDRNGLSYREFLDVAILVGTDEAQGQYKNYISEAIQEVRDAEDLDALEDEHNEYLRGPSLRVGDPAPTFTELHDLYTDPPVTPNPARPVPTAPDPDFAAVGDFIFQELKQTPEMLETLLDPIQETV